MKRRVAEAGDTSDAQHNFHHSLTYSKAVPEHPVPVSFPSFILGMGMVSSGGEYRFGLCFLPALCASPHFQSMKTPGFRVSPAHSTELQWGFHTKPKPATRKKINPLPAKTKIPSRVSSPAGSPPGCLHPNFSKLIQLLLSTEKCQLITNIHIKIFKYPQLKFLIFKYLITHKWNEIFK